MPLSVTAALVVVIALAPPPPASAQIPQTFKNLQVLPNDIPRAELDEALEMLRLNATMFPKSANAHANLGDAAMQKGDLTAAEAAYQRALELEPGHPAATNGLATIKAKR